jgi:[ribosomal protein S18]-alanine N-acetyltransferase
MKERSMETMQSTFRPMRTSDVPGVLKVLAQSPEAACWSAASLESAASGGAAWVVTRDSELIKGFLIGRIAADEFEILNLAVARDCRRQGIASRLLDAALNHSRSAGCTQAFLEVRESNAPAISLYDQYGFSEAGRRNHYYTSPDEDAVLLVLRLTSNP